MLLDGIEKAGLVPVGQYSLPLPLVLFLQKLLPHLDVLFIRRGLVAVRIVRHLSLFWFLNDEWLLGLLCVFDGLALA